MPDSRLSELYLEALTNSGTPGAVTLAQDSRLSELYLEALTNAGTPTAVTLAQDSQLSEVYVEALTDSGPLVIAFADSGTSAGADYPSALVADGASAYYPLDEAVGTNLYSIRDTIGGYGIDSYGGTVTLGRPPATAKLGGTSVRFFNGQIVLQGRFVGAITSAFMCGWVKPELNGSFNAAVFRLTYNQTWFNFELQADGTPVFYLFLNGPGSLTFTVPGVNLNDGAWHFVALSFNQTTGEIGAWIDGVRRVTSVVSSGSTLPQNFTYYPRIGDNGGFIGEIDAFAYGLNVALTNAQALELYRAGTAYAEALQVAVNTTETDAATASDSFVGGPVYQVTDATAVGTESLRVFIIASPGPREEVSPDAVESGNDVQLHRVRVGGTVYVEPDPLDTGSSVSVTPRAGRVQVAPNPITSGSKVSVNPHIKIVLSNPLYADSASRVSVSAGSVTSGGTSDVPPPASLQPTPDATTVVSPNPPMRLFWHANAVLRTVNDGALADPTYDPYAGLTDADTTDQQEPW